jgi:hypothetical protein
MKDDSIASNIELRHQRNPDVVFDYVREDKALTEDKPQFVYQIIETLLPTANYDEQTGIKLLELYAFNSFTLHHNISDCD